MSQQSSKPRVWWRDPSTLGDAANILAAIVAVALTILDLFDLLEVGWFQANLEKLTLLLVSLVVISNVIERRFRTTKLQANLLKEIHSIRTGPYSGVIGFYSDRKELEPFAKMVEPAKQELFIVGIELNLYWPE